MVRGASYYLMERFGKEEEVGEKCVGGVGGGGM